MYLHALHNGCMSCAWMTSHSELNTSSNAGRLCNTSLPLLNDSTVTNVDLAVLFCRSSRTEDADPRVQDLSLDKGRHDPRKDGRRHSDYVTDGREDPYEDGHRERQSHRAHKDDGREEYDGKARGSRDSARYQTEVEARDGAEGSRHRSRRSRHEEEGDRYGDGVERQRGERRSSRREDDVYEDANRGHREKSSHREARDGERERQSSRREGSRRTRDEDRDRCPPPPPPGPPALLPPCILTSVHGLDFSQPRLTNYCLGP